MENIRNAEFTFLNVNRYDNNWFYVYIKKNLGQLYESDTSSQGENDIYDLTTVSKRAWDTNAPPLWKTAWRCTFVKWGTHSVALPQFHDYWPTVFRLIKYEWHKGVLLTLINGKPRPRFSRDSGHLSAPEVNGNDVCRDKWLDREIWKYIYKAKWICIRKKNQNSLIHLKRKQQNLSLPCLLNMNEIYW